SSRCKNDHATCCRTSQTRTPCFRRRCQLCLLIRFPRLRREVRNPFSPEQFFPFSPTWRLLSLGSAWFLSPVLEKLSPSPLSWESVAGLVLELPLVLARESHSISPPLVLPSVSE